MCVSVVVLVVIVVFILLFGGRENKTEMQRKSKVQIYPFWFGSLRIILSLHGFENFSDCCYLSFFLFIIIFFITMTVIIFLSFFRLNNDL